MNEDTLPSGVPDVPWPTSDQRGRAPEMSILAAADKAKPAAVDSLNHVIQSAHGAMDRFADGASAKVRQLGDSVSGAEASLRSRADRLGRTRDEWAEGLRGKVRSNPMTAVIAALALGAVIARVTR